MFKAFILNKFPILRIIKRKLKIKARIENLIINDKRKLEILNSFWRDHNYVIGSLAKDRKKLIKDFKSQNIEHQIGRYLNMEKVVKEVSERNIAGDILEFGTYRGTGLCLLSNCFLNNNINQDGRKFIGVDSFEGLPETSNMWVKGAFNDTSIELAKKNLLEQFSSENNFALVKGWFNDPKVAIEIENLTKRIAIVHFDADLGSSTISALKIVENFLTGITDSIYFLFDDWGHHKKEVPLAYENWLKINSEKYNFKSRLISETRLTSYFRLDFGK